MEAPMKFICILGLLAALSIAGFERVDGASPCGKATPDEEAVSLAPCATAAQDAKASVPAACCQQTKRLGKNPSCLCAVLLSDSAKNSGVNPQIAITIPKRCNFANRPVGYKCGAYTLP